MRAVNSAEQGSAGGVQSRKSVAEPVPSRGAALDDEVLREIRHALGNHFHKLYYWADYVQDIAGGKDEEAAVQPLTGSIQRLEAFLALAMEYLQPPRIEPISMRIEDVAAAAAEVVRSELEGAEIEVEVDADLCSRQVELDPGRFSEVLRRVGGALGAHGAGGLLGVRLSVKENSDMRAVEMRVMAPVALGGVTEGDTESLAWAIAQRTMEAHGGALSACESEESVAQVTLLLPLGG